MAHTRNKEVSIGCLDYTVNSFFMITSTITLLISLTLKYEFSIFGNYLNYYSGTPTLLLLIISVATLLDAICGFVSLKKKTRCGVITFAICTMYLFVSVVTLVGVTLIFSVEAEQKLYSNLKEDMRNQTANNDDTIDAIQSHLNCCGYKDFTDWLNVSSNNLPQSCCTFSVICDAKNSSDVHRIGCEDAVGDFLTCRKWLVVGVLAILGLIEIYSIILSLIVYHRLAKIPTTPPPLNNIPRVNPLPPVGNTVVPYVRRPTQLPVVLTYRSAHENFLKQPPQNRFDRRLMLPNVKYTIPHAK